MQGREHRKSAIISQPPLLLACFLYLGSPCRWRGTRCCCYRKLDLLRGGELPAARKGTPIPWLHAHIAAMDMLLAP